MASVVVDPGALRITYVALDEPLRHTTTGMDGKEHTRVWHGLRRVEWDSPEGLLTVMSAEQDELSPEDYEDLRPYMAEQMQRAYEQGKAEDR